MRPGSPWLSPQQEPLSSFRQSMNILSSELIRNSYAGGQSIPNIYRQSFNSSLRQRNSMNVEMAESLRKQLGSPVKNDKSTMNNLKTTLGELEKKLNKAKKQLNTYKNIISEEEDDSNDQSEEIRRGENEEDCKEAVQTFQQSTNLDSLSSKLVSNAKIGLDLKALAKIKTYYLVELMNFLQGKSTRAGDHLTISLKVLRNYFKIESPSFSEIEEKKVNLPRDKSDANKKTLLIDIDETIIHCEEDSTKPYDIILPIQVESGDIAKAYITIRPYAISFLKRMSKHFQIIAFTASHESYADVVLDQIDPGKQFIKHRLYRRNCIQIHENIYAKDLRIVNRDLSQIVLLDNAPYSYIFQLQNGIPILPYYSGVDSELPLLQKYLQELAKCSDVREMNKKTFKLHRYCNFSDPQELVRELYLSPENL